MIYKIKMMSGTEIPIDGEEALMEILNKANSGAKLILTKYGVINVQSIDSIVPYKEKLEEVMELLRLGKNIDDAKKYVLGESPFSRLLSNKMSMLPQQRTEAQEEASREERKLKR
jgi:hypothetical protein